MSFRIVATRDELSRDCRSSSSAPEQAACTTHPGGEQVFNLEIAEVFADPA
ncbi:hypothetical protein WN51_04070 [Melipona quadrifasciata]|uniref:Uncharacterized protein n=1 Tax=Melipona quadrifasciata TaxID=166423 RepID=A0A0N0BC73_9HYME|nr:hypothetical protein WN51_04070 [Melipona quadrifasciata]